MDRVHEIPLWMAWHGRLMVLGWLVLLPLGIFIARFFKVTPRQDWPAVLDNKLWWRSHLGFQYTGILLMTLAMLLATLNDGPVTNAGLAHRACGWIVVILGWGQIVGGLLRGSKGGPTAAMLAGDHYDMTPRRVTFERLHKSGGYLALGLSVATIVLGLRLANAPDWMLVGAVVGWIVWVAAFLWLQSRGRCIDTYQAIWGPDSRHPGNARRPIGFGIRRPRP